MYLDAPLQFSLGQASLAGVKSVNEDSIGIRVPDGSLLTNKGACAVIADGVSAAEAGKEASDTSVTYFLSDYFSTPDTWTVKKSAHQVLVALNRWLYSQGQRFLHADKGYVTTLSVVIFKSHTAHLFHIGDSRIYRFRRGELEQLTTDHATRISRDQAYLTRAIGLDVNVDVDYRRVELQQGDIYLLSTDGLHDFLSGREICTVLDSLDDGREKDLESACNTLIAQALENQSGDNLSCQIIRIDSLPSESIDEVCQKLTELPFPPALEPGMVLDDLQIIEEISASPRSQLYRVIDLDTGQACVMKTPSANFDDDPAYIERFVLESWIGNRVDSPYIVAMMRRNRSKSCLYYLMEAIDGVPVTEWCRRLSQSNITARVALLEQLISGVRAMHRKEILHQDLKPENILVDERGNLKIIDFGSCFVAGINEIAVPIERDTILGTANYTAPEPVLGRKSTTKSDLFSIAVIFYEMLTGKQPYDGKLEQCRSLQAYSNLQYSPSLLHNPHVPVWMDGAIAKSLSISPQLRYQEVSEFLFDVQHPNPEFLRERSRPLLMRNPLRFWQVVTGLLVLSQLVTLYLLVA